MGTMLNFGVREVANSKAATAPGWAYVPDTGVNASVAALQPASRKRARNQTVASSHETTARQDAKILRELASLDRENAKDVSIPVPIRHRDNAGRVSHGKVTSNFEKSSNPKRHLRTICQISKRLHRTPLLPQRPNLSRRQ